MPAAASDGNAIQQLKEVKIEGLEQRLCRALTDGQLAPGIECGLCTAEDLINRVRGIQLFVDLGGIPLISQGELIAQISKAIVDRCCREHQHLGLHASADHLVHQAQIAVFALIFAAAQTSVSEIVGFIDHHQVIVSPVEQREVRLPRKALLAGKIRMVQHIIPQAILRNGIVDIIALVHHPVFRELFGAQNEHGFIAVFIILDHSQRCKGLAQTYAVRKDAAVEGLQPVDDSQRSIPLKVVELLPDLGILKSRRFIGQVIFRDVLKKRAEDIVQRKK